MKSSGLHAKFQVFYPVDLEKVFEVCLTVNGRGGHLRHMTKTSRKKTFVLVFHVAIYKRLKSVQWFQRRSHLKMLTDGRQRAAIF